MISALVTNESQALEVGASLAIAVAAEDVVVPITINGREVLTVPSRQNLGRTPVLLLDLPVLGKSLSLAPVKTLVTASRSLPALNLGRAKATALSPSPNQSGRFALGAVESAREHSASVTERLRLAGSRGTRRQRPHTGAAQP